MIKKYVQYIKESAQIKGSFSLYNKLNTFNSNDKKEIIEVLKRVFIEVDDIKLLTSVKKFFSEYCNFIMKINMRNSNFQEGKGVSYSANGEYNGYNGFEKGDYMGQWGEWKNLDYYRHSWDYKLSLTEFAQIINSLHHIFNISIKETIPVFNEKDPYGEENWDD